MFARCLSSLQNERVKASSQLKGPTTTRHTGNKKEFIEHIRKVMLQQVNQSQNRWVRVDFGCVT